jgi:hypothetical protein
LSHEQWLQAHLHLLAATRCRPTAFLHDPYDSKSCLPEALMVAAMGKAFNCREARNFIRSPEPSALSGVLCLAWCHGKPGCQPRNPVCRPRPAGFPVVRYNLTRASIVRAAFRR